MATKRQTSRIGGIVRSARETIGSAKEKAVEAKDRAEDMIKEKPFVSVAVAAAVGALVAIGVSALITHRHRSIFDRVRDYF